MGKRKDRAVSAGPPVSGEPEAPASPTEESVAPQAGEPLGKLWTWTPDAPVEEVPLSARVADVIREVEVAAPVKPTDGSPVGVLWSWTPPAQGTAPPEARPAPTPATPVAPPPPAEPEAAPAPSVVLPEAPVFQPTAAAPPVIPPPAEVPAKRLSRRERRREQASRSVVEAPVEAPPAAEPEAPPATPDAASELPAVLPEAPVFQPTAAAPLVVPPPAEVPAKRLSRRERRREQASRPVVEAPVETPPAAEPEAPPATRTEVASDVPVVLPEVPVFQPTDAEPVAEVLAPVHPPAQVPVKNRNRSKGKRAAKPVPLPPAESPAVPEAELTTLRPVFALDPDLVLPSPTLLAPPVLEEQYDEPWAQQAPAPSRLPRGVRIAGVLAFLVTCAALPWAVPQIPDLFAEAVPEQASTPRPSEQPIEPPKPLPSGGVKVNKSLAGKKLASAGIPLEVTVDRLHIRSNVVPISGATGELIPPDDAQVLGWWQEGVGVGSAMGSSVITGHTVSDGGGAFDHLGELVPGDEVSVRTAKGTIVYIVREAQDLRVEELARTAKSIFQQTGDGRLVLITCSDFNGKIYLSNAVVYASPLKDLPRSRK